LHCGCAVAQKQCNDECSYPLSIDVFLLDDEAADTYLFDLLNTLTSVTNAKALDKPFVNDG